MVRKWFEKARNPFALDIGIDLGTANVLVYVAGHGIIINEPSVVAVNHKTGRVVAVGAEAKRMIGRTPPHIEAIRPLVGGVISDFEVTEEMLSYFLRKARMLERNRFLRPRVLIGVPSGTTNVERRAVRDAALGAGAGRVYLLDEPVAAAIGIRLPVHEPVGNMVVDIGGGTTDIAVISLSGIVTANSVQVAGDALNRDILNYIRDEFKIMIGERTAEDLKLILGHKGEEEVTQSTVRGRDLVSGLPREVIITESDVRVAVAQSISSILSAIKQVLETTPPEVLSDVMKRGVMVVGGGSLILGLREMLEEELNMPVYIPEDPLTAVVRGTGIVLANFDMYHELMIDDDNAPPPTQ
ncbi:MAG: rod shape-determining protein [bacterium]|nr:rod shape-determining protein [bacterium]